MADNTLQNGTDTIATDDVTTLNGGASTGVKVQRVKVGFGSDNTLRDVDAANGLPVVTYNNSLVSTANSTATALALNAVFTGTAEDVSEYSLIFVTVFTDQISAIDGLRVQHSSNGTNWDMEDAFSIPASTGKTFSFGVQAKFSRVVYTNGATASTVMRLQTIYSKSAKKNSSVRPQDGRANDNDMEEMLSYQMHYDSGTNSWNKMRGTIASGITVSGSRLNSGASTAAGNTHLTVGGSDGTNLRPLLVDTAGRLSVIGAFFQATQPVSGTFFQATQPVSGAFFQATQPVSAATLPLPTGASTEATLAGVRTDLGTDGTTPPTVLGTGTGVRGWLRSIYEKLTGTLAVTGTFFQATQPVSLATNTPDVTDRAARLLGIIASITGALPTGANTIGTVNLATPTAFNLSSAATTNATSVKATAGTVFQVVASNVGAAAAFLKLFNLATAPTVGTSVPFLTVPIPATGIVTIPLGALGMRFGTGIALSITNLIADTDTTVIAAAQVKVAISYI